MENQEIIYCEDCQHCFKSSRSPTGYSCEVWGFGDFACYVPLDGYCHKAVSKNYELRGKDMDFNKPIHAEVEGDDAANEFRDYLISHGIEFKESTDNYKFEGDYHIFDCVMTKGDMLEANENTSALFYR